MHIAGDVHYIWFEPPRMEHENESPRRAALLRGALFLVLFLCVGALWRFGPLGHLVDARRLAALGARLSHRPDATLLVLGAYLAGALLLFPMTLLLGATALVFDPARALALGLGGALAAAAMTYGIGRLLARRGARWLDGPRVAHWRARLARRGIVAVAGLRLVPIGSFSISNIAAGALPIPFRAFLLGNFLGLLPGLLALTLFADRLRALGWVGP
jgi:uncharacterized membrane protein YdjX (TVP38/TMEM64 family)